MDFQNNFKDYLSKKQTDDEDTTTKESRELQEAIDKSKESAEEEQQVREYERQFKEIQKKVYKPAANKDTHDEPELEKPSTLKQRSNVPKAHNPGKNILLSFHDLIDVSGVTLDIVYHKPVFDRVADLSCNLKHRAAIFSRHFTEIEKLKAQLCQQSLERAPRPNLIHAKAGESIYQDVLGKTPNAPIYTCRSGRQTKRKVYTEQLEGDSDSEHEFSKKSRSDDLLSVRSSSGETLSSNSPKMRKPASLSLKTYSSRSEQMFDKIIEEEASKRKQQDEMDVFEDTLPTLTEGDDNWEREESPERYIKEDEESFVRRRVIPPMPTRGRNRGRKPAKEDGRKRDLQSLHIQDSPLGSPTLKRYASITKSPETKSKPKAKPLKKEPAPASTELQHSPPLPSTSGLQKSPSVASKPSTSGKFQKATCPICGGEFLQSEIVNHASTCGEGEDEEPGPSRPRRNLARKMACELCGLEFVMSEYEAHVKSCIASQVTSL